MIIVITLRPTPYYHDTYPEAASKYLLQTPRFNAMNPSLLDHLRNFPLTPHDPEERFMTSGVNWQQYENLWNNLTANNAHYRLTYLDGLLEIMSPSRRHEVSKKNISRLLEAYLEENRIRFWALGSTTFHDRQQTVGKEPDECYCFETEKEIPDLAIEIVLTSGGIDQLTIYQRLGVREIWFWQDHQFYLYGLENNAYQLLTHSQLLPQLDLSLLAQYVETSEPLEAIVDYRQAIRGVR
jgi:Uma2 family endonuclease